MIAQQTARERFDSMTVAEIAQDLRDRTASIRKNRRESCTITSGAERAMRKMLTEELGMQRVRYSTVVALHRILARLEITPHAQISQYDDTLGDEKTIRGLQHVLAEAEYLTQEPKFYGNGKATMQAFRGTGKPRHRVWLITSENYWDGVEDFLSYSQPGPVWAESAPVHVNASDVPC